MTALRHLLSGMTMATLCSCGGGGSGGGSSSGAAAIPIGPTTAPVAQLQGNISNLAGCGLVLQINGLYDTALLCGLATPNSNSSGTSIGWAGIPGLVSGTSYSLSVKTQPTAPRQICVVSNGSSGTYTGSLVTNITIDCTTVPGRFLYAVNASGNSISSYGINASTGTLTEMPGSPFQASSGPTAIIVDRASRFALVVNQAVGTVSTYAINGTSGALSASGAAAVATGQMPLSLSMDSSARFVYVTNGSSATVSAYSFNTSNGALTALRDSPYLAGNSPGAVLTSTSRFSYGAPAAAYVYAVNAGTNDLSGYTLNGDTGGLAALGSSPYGLGLGPRAVAVDYTNRFLYVANSISNSITAFAITNPAGYSVPNTSVNANSGSLTAISGSPFLSGGSPWALAVHPAGRFLYVANRDAGTLSIFAINTSTGALIAASSTPVATGVSPVSLVIDGSGSFLYVANSGSNTVSGYAINATTGALTPISGSPFATGSMPVSLAIAD